MSTEIILSSSPALQPITMFTPTPAAAKRVLEFFTAQINNDHTRRAYLNATRRFAEWCDGRELHQLALLHSFTGSDGDGSTPLTGVSVDKTGSLYGTTEYGGSAFDGTIFKLSLNDGSWTETILHTFHANGIDGFYPQGGITLDWSGNLFGTATDGGVAAFGIAFELSPSGGGYNAKILHAFGSSGPLDGEFPRLSVVLDKNGNLYGTTEFGGETGSGVAYRLTP